MNKKLIVTMSDKTRWAIPADLIARHRARYYAERDSKRDDVDYYMEIFHAEVEIALNDEYELLDWASNSMDWKDVARFARFVRQIEVPRTVIILTGRTHPKKSRKGVNNETANPRRS